MKNNITIIGFGTMGKAIARVLTKNNRSFKVFGVDIGDSKKIIKNSKYVILAVKPQDSSKMIKEVRETGLDSKTILVSIMTGISIKTLRLLSGHKKIIRMMPNLGLLVNSGIAVWKAEGLSPREKKNAEKFLGMITENFEIKNEDTIDKVTAISGSGPAYFFLLAKSMMDSAVKLGFKKDEARKLVEKTFSAGAILAKKSDYSELIKKVASKKGTTEVALKVFQKEKFEKTVEKAISAAYKRAKELSN